MEQLQKGVENLNIQNYAEKIKELKGLPNLPKEHITLKETDSKDVTINTNFVDPQGNYTLTKPFTAQIVSARYISSNDSVKRCIQMEVDISGSNISFHPGDSFGVFCENVDEETLALLNYLKIEPSTRYHVSSSQAESTPYISTASEIIGKLDIRGPPKKAFLRLLSEFCSNDKDKYELLLLSSRQGADEYRKIAFEQPLTFLELLEKYSCKPPLSRILENLPALPPRYFSVSSSPLHNPNRFSIIFNVVKFQTHSGEKKGICTTYLEKIAKNFKEPVSIRVFKRPLGTGFRLTDESNRPILMIAAGTGVSPFISFIQHRSIAKGEEVGENWLFFGCRHPDKDFIYKEEFQAFQEKGHLHKLVTAFSRHGEKVEYVQHKLVEHGKDIHDFILNKNAIIYVCGDAKTMGKNVQEAIIHIVSEHSAINKEESAAKVAQWIKEKRYLQDMWT